MTKLDSNCLKCTTKQKLCKHYLDDCFVRRKKNEPDHLFSKINSLHEKCGFTIEIDPVKLDTKLIKENGTHSTAVHYKVTKITPHWTSAVPERYKRNTIEQRYKDIIGL